MKAIKHKEFRKELEHLINRCSEENGSNTPDFILADFLVAALAAFDAAVVRRDKWYDGVVQSPGVDR
jgi:hypothetical protein